MLNHVPVRSIPINENHMPKTAKITPSGLYEFNVTIVGLCNAPSSFQRYINEIFTGQNFVFPYLEDVLTVKYRRGTRKTLKIIFG